MDGHKEHADGEEDEHAFEIQTLDRRSVLLARHRPDYWSDIPKHVSGAQPGAPPDVEVVQVEQKDVPIYGEWIGTLDGFTNADVRAQVTGYLLRQGYQEGAFVKKGQLLFEIDPRPFQAALDQAQGQLAQAKASLPTPKRCKAELNLMSNVHPAGQRTGSQPAGSRQRRSEQPGGQGHGGDRRGAN